MNEREGKERDVYKRRNREVMELREKGDNFIVVVVVISFSSCFRILSFEKKV